MRVIAYTRVSTDKQADKGHSLATQRKKLEQYAKLYDLEIVAHLKDEGISAKNMDRPGLKRAIELLECGKAEGLLVTKLDRLTRSLKDLLHLTEQFRDNKWALMSVAEQIDTSSAAGRMVINLLGVINQWERETIGERTKEVLAHLKTQGVQLGAPHLGNRRTDGEAVHTKIQRVRDSRLEGMSVRRIAAHVGLHPTQVQRILKRSV